jgi:hypothetical protein
MEFNETIDIKSITQGLGHRMLHQWVIITIINIIIHTVDSWHLLFMQATRHIQETTMLCPVRTIVHQSVHGYWVYTREQGQYGMTWISSQRLNSIHGSPLAMWVQPLSLTVIDFDFLKQTNKQTNKKLRRCLVNHSLITSHSSTWIGIIHQSWNSFLLAWLWLNYFLILHF